MGKISYNDIISNENYYVFASKHTPYAGESDQVISTPVDTVQSASKIFNDMIFGKRLTASDTIPVINRYDWSSGSVFAEYDDQISLANTMFYCSVNRGDQLDVYKCLYNNNSSQSTVEPSGYDSKPFITPNDGYVWKYMYTANSYILDKFSTVDYIPVINSANNSYPGSIDAIKIEDPGSNYNNYTVGLFESSSDIKVGGDPYIYSLGSNANPVDNFYNNCVLVMTSGNAQDEYKTIVDYYVSGGKKIVVLDDIFTGVVSPSDTYEVYPKVNVYDTGDSATVNCVARALIDSISNNVHYVDILNPGLGYRSAVASISPDTSVGVTSNSSLRPILPPYGGHGYDSVAELCSTSVGLRTTFVGGESVISSENDYRTIGIVKDPLFANVNIKVDDTTRVGFFHPGEDIYQYKPLLLTTNAIANGTNIITSSENFGDGINPGDYVSVTSNSFNDIKQVESVSNSSYVVLTSNVDVLASGCNVSFIRNSKKVGTLVSNTSFDMSLTDVNYVDFSTSNHLYGANSSAIIDIDLTASDDTRVTINGRSADSFMKYSQLTSFKGLINPGVSFIEDEEVYQPSYTGAVEPTAKFHSIVDNTSGPTDIMYLTGVNGSFKTLYDANSDGVIIGRTSGAQFTLYNKYIGDIIPESGKILYIENLDPVSRSNATNETFKLFISF